MSDTQDEMVSERVQQQNTHNAKETETKVENSKRRTAMEERDKIYFQHFTKRYCSSPLFLARVSRRIANIPLIVGQ